MNTLEKLLATMDEGTAGGARTYVRIDTIRNISNLRKLEARAWFEKHATAAGFKVEWAPNYEYFRVQR